MDSFVVGQSGQHWEDYRSARLYDAAARGRTASVNDQLGEGVNPDWCNPEDRLTPLHITALKGRAGCVLLLLRAGADIYATGTHGCTVLDLFLEQRTLFRLCDRFFTSRNYKDCQAYLEKAHADCQHRAKDMEKYQGVVVINPGEELGLVREKVSKEVRDVWRHGSSRSSSSTSSARASESEHELSEEVELGEELCEEVCEAVRMEARDEVRAAFWRLKHSKVVLEQPSHDLDLDP